MKDVKTCYTHTKATIDIFNQLPDTFSHEDLKRLGYSNSGAYHFAMRLVGEKFVSRSQSWPHYYIKNVKQLKKGGE